MDAFVKALVDYVREDPQAFPSLHADMAPRGLALALVTEIEESADTLEASGDDPMGLGGLIKDMIRALHNDAYLYGQLGDELKAQLNG